MSEGLAAATAKNPGARPWGKLLRFLPIALVALAFAAILASGVWRHLSLSDLEARRTALKGFVHLHPIYSVLIYVAAYCMVVALSIPGALFMTLTGGVLFGVLVGGAAAVVGVSSGAVLMFLAAHTAIGDVIHKRAPPDGLIRKVEAKVSRNAFFYLLALRLMPAAPIWLVNIAAAFVRTPLWIYSLATVLGVAPSTFIYAGVGASLDQVFAKGGRPNLQALFHWRVVVELFALAILALLPIAVQAARRRGALPKSST